MPFKKILIATDGSDLAKNAVSKGLALAKELGASVVAVTVTVPWSSIVSGEMSIAYSHEQYLKGAKQHAEQLLGAVAGEAEKNGLSCETIHVTEKFVSEGVLETAKQHGCDLIVMASHGRRGLSRFFLGSQTDEVLVQTDVAVLVVR
ncbi:MAG: universal stress protein [Pseudomonadota bacterium]